MDDLDGPGVVDAVDYDWDAVSALVQPYLASVGVAAGGDALDKLGLFDKRATGLMRADAKAYAERRAAELVGMKRVGGKLVANPGWSIPEATRDELRGLATTALDEGWSAGKLATMIRDAAAFGTDRAETVARTELAMADTAGTIAGWTASGLVTAKEWLTAPDCCDECQDMDGKQVPIDEDFDDGDPPLHPNCRCCLLNVLNDESGDDDGNG